ncbi:DUF2628 domain-containing protein [Bacillus sp. LL01]|uniref:DUF2628 domain-containing protein n=1 Tax=Bacillus sp. LL01 TaxID=1665556 RepID=UPI00069F0EB3|nr:DUF2628 domain-containing protein [Bacillus sp. LL01]
MYCISCGEKQPTNAIFCSKCGAAHDEPSYTSLENNMDAPQKEVAASIYPIGQSEPHGMGPKEEALREFVGPNDDYYCEKWGLEVGSEVRKQSWNWAAFFLSISWMGYRKMYFHIFVIFLIFLLLDGIMYSAGTPSKFDYLIGIGTGAFLGVLGNYLYYIHSSKKIEKHQQNGNYNLDSIRTSGGKSILGIFVAVSMVIIYSIITTFIFVI